MRLAFRNTRRHPRRILLTTLAIGIAVAAVTFMDAYVKGAMNSFMESYIRIDSGHVKIIPREAVGRSRALPLDNGVTDLTSLLNIVEQVPGVLDVSPRIRFPVLLDKPGGGIPAMGVAVDISREANLMNLEEFVERGRLPESNSWETMIGISLAEELELDVGGELFVVTTDAYGGLGPGLYEVVGISRTGIGMIDRKTFYVPLNIAQDQLAMYDAAVEVVLRVENGMDDSEKIAADMNMALERENRTDVVAVPWKQQGNVYQIFAPAKYMTFVVMLLLGIIALTTVVNTVLMSVMERTREIGALRALGFNRQSVIRMILGESLLIGIAATFLGLIAGMTVALILHKTGIDFTSALESVELPLKPIIYPEPSIFTALKSALFGIIVSILAAWYPARIAVRLKPAEALRTD